MFVFLTFKKPHVSFHQQTALFRPASVEQEVFLSYNQPCTLITKLYGFSLTDGQSGYKWAELKSSSHCHHAADTDPAAAAAGSIRWVAWLSFYQIQKHMSFIKLIFIVFGCGTPAVKPDTNRIVNGEDARPHSWPWQVSSYLCSFMSYSMSYIIHVFCPDLPAGEAWQPLPSHLWRNFDCTALGADRWTLYLVTNMIMEECIRP